MTKTKLTYWIKIISELGKVRISLPIALSAYTGYALQTGRFGAEALILMAGVFLMSCSSGAINHLQEYKTDALMPRTKNRPIPSGKISLNGALRIAIAYFVSGGLILLSAFPILVFLTSVLTLISYNAIYTPLKKVTAFAVVPGSLVGALPPYIGWFAGGGDWMNHQIFWVGLFFFIGQIPHFWLLLLMFGKEYELAGFPSLHKIFSDNQIKRLSFTWIVATVATAIVVAVHVLQGSIIMFFLLMYIFYILFSLSASILIKNDLKVRPAFFKLNFLYLLMMIVLILDSVQ
ncbi:MAG TPA: protoheme IX farnesyltransferase [Prolixibacteraceae bacterium]|nr:protoheme IX farnesyltransferase [Prolixibacteraceae bacterium]